VLYSLLATCQLHALDPFVYLRDFLERLRANATDAVAELTPTACARSPPEDSAPEAP